MSETKSAEATGAAIGATTAGMAGAANLSGDWKLRTPMSWTGDPVRAGFTTGTPWNGYYEAISCPDGYLRDSEESVHLNCERFHLFCQPDLHCVCRPCIPDMVLQMYPVQVRLSGIGKW